MNNMKGRAMLTDEEVLALKVTLVRDNECITHIRFESGTYGAGNTNTSAYEGSTRDYPLRRYEGEILHTRRNSARGIQIAAVVEDILYLVKYNHGTIRVVRLRPYQADVETEAIAYDTRQRDSIMAVSDIVHTLETACGSYTGSAVRGVPEGQGVLIFREGDPEGRVRCEGCFEDGIPARYCEITYRDGSCYRGLLARGVRHGFGKLFDACGTLVYSGMWQNGERA